MVQFGVNILIGVSASVAAHRALDLASALRKAGHEVAAVFSDHAPQLLSPLAMEAVTGRRVVTSLWDQHQGGSMDHLALTKWADLFVVVPATANTLANLALGIGSDAMGTMALAWPQTRPLILCPAMNPTMYAHPVVQQHQSTLESRGALFIGPVDGDTACRDVGLGRLAPVDMILESILSFYRLPRIDLRGQTVLVTGGPTAEPIDPVRQITNPSTGRMAIALAQEAHRAGAEVLLVLGPTSLPTPASANRLEIHRIRTAQEMAECVARLQPRANALIFAAAVADWTPANPAEGKLRKETLAPDASITIELVRTPDVALQAHQERRPGQIMVGFSADSDDPVQTALQKAQRKGFNLVFANPIDQPDAGFGSDTNHGWLIEPRPAASPRDPRVEAITVTGKTEVARRILERLSQLLAGEKGCGD